MLALRFLMTASFESQHWLFRANQNAEFSEEGELEMERTNQNAGFRFTTIIVTVIHLPLAEPQRRRLEETPILRHISKDS